MWGWTLVPHGHSDHQARKGRKGFDSWSSHLEHQPCAAPSLQLSAPSKGCEKGNMIVLWDSVRWGINVLNLFDLCVAGGWLWAAACSGPE